MPDLPRLTPPGTVLDITRRLEDAGHETWAVGGAVRDALLGHPHLDWDLATAAKPKEVQRLFRRTIPVGIEFGTVGVLDDNGIMHEVTTFRHDVRTDGRHAVVQFGASLDDDLARRDFTINAVAYHPLTHELRDPHSGLKDLERKVVRAVGDPAERMREDRLRALRGIRFAARFGFTIDDDTWQAIAASAPHLGRLSAERVKQEIEKTMEQVAFPSVAFRLWLDGGAMRVLVPALHDLSDVALATLDALPPPPPKAARIPSPSKKGKSAGRPPEKQLPHHPRAGQRRSARIAALLLDLEPRVAEGVLKSLRFSNSETRWVVTIVELWRQLGAEMASALPAPRGPSDAQIRRWAAAAGRPVLGPFLRIAYARWCAQSATGGAAKKTAAGRTSAAAAPDARTSAPDAAAVRSLYRRALRIAWRDPVTIADLAVDGGDLRREGIPAGPIMGKILSALLERVLEDPSLNTRDKLIDLARALYRGMQGDRE